MNMKSGMSDEEFERYINNTIIPLFPVMEDNKELEVLLRWKGVPVSKMGNMASKRALYQQFIDLSICYFFYQQCPS